MSEAPEKLELELAAADVVAWFDLCRPDLAGNRIRRLRYALAATDEQAFANERVKALVEDIRIIASNPFLKHETRQSLRAALAAIKPSPAA